MDRSNIIDFKKMAAKLAGAKAAEVEEAGDWSACSPIDLVRLLCYHLAVYRDDATAKQAMYEAYLALRDEPPVKVPRKVADAVDRIDRMALADWISDFTDG